MSSTILIVDDEKQVCDLLSRYIEQDGYHTMTASNGSKAVQLAKDFPLGLIVLDLMLPDVSGEEVCRQIRAFSRVPILMLTAKSGENDRLTGLAIGADDYLIKPFSPRELVARIRAILRRSGEYDTLGDVMSIGELTIDLAKRTVRIQDSKIDLTSSEYRILTTLARQLGRVWSREELGVEVFGLEFSGSDRSIDSHIKNLRQKLGDDPKQPTYIKTVYGAGYRLERADSDGSTS